MYSMFIHDISIKQMEQKYIHPILKIGCGRTYSPCLSCKESGEDSQHLPTNRLMGPGELGRIKSFYDDKGNHGQRHNGAVFSWFMKREIQRRLVKPLYKGTLAYMRCVLIADVLVQRQDMDLSSAQELHNNLAEISSFIRRCKHAWPSSAFKITYFLSQCALPTTMVQWKISPRWNEKSNQDKSQGMIPFLVLQWWVPFEAQLNGFKVGDEARFFGI